MSSENSPPIKIFVDPDKMSASLSLPAGEYTYEKITEELKKCNVFNGYKEDAIVHCIQMASMGESVSGEIVAEYCPNPAHMIIAGESMEFNHATYKKYTQLLSNTAKGFFISKDSVAWAQPLVIGGIDVAGNAIETKALPHPPRHSSHFKIQSDATTFKILADCSGLLQFTSNGTLSITPVLSYSEDKMLCELHQIPLEFGSQNYHSFVQNEWDLRNQKRDAFSYLLREEELFCEEESLLPRTVPFCKGTPPTQGSNAVLTHYWQQKSTEAKPHETVNLRNTQALPIVNKGDCIAEVVPAKQPTDGIDATGAILPADPVQSLEVKAGEHVLKNEKDGCIVFTAEESGLVSYANQEFKIQRLLHIKGDVCYATGNIDFDGNVIVEGNVLSLFTIRCTGDLWISGFIENGVKIHAGGTLETGMGIIGPETSVVCKGNASIQFIQSAHIHVDSKLEVRGSIVDADVFCKELQVQGEKIKMEDKGCVIGGVVAALNTIDLHSVGSYANITKLVCGLSPHVIAPMRAIRQNVKRLAMQSSRVQNEMGIQLDAPNAAEVLQNMPPSRKEFIRKKLLELKQINQTIAQHQAALNELMQKATNPQPENCRIQVQNALFPKVHIQIGEYDLLVPDCLSQLEFKLHNQKVTMYSL
jgi:uncharacterized protein